MTFKVMVTFVLLATYFPCAHAEGAKSEKDVGRDIVALFLGAAPLLAETETQEYINTLGHHIVGFLPDNQRARDWTFGVIETDSVNAFAAPGGYILITQGLLDLTETEDQLAFILAHEISHVVKEHHLSVIRKQSKLLSVVSRMQGKMTNQSDTFSELSGIYRDFATRGLDKKAEYEADLDGTVLATKAGYNSHASMELLYVLSRYYDDGNESELFFKTHPHPLTRVDLLIDLLPSAFEDYAVNSRPSSAFERLKF